MVARDKHLTSNLLLMHLESVAIGHVELDTGTKSEISVFSLHGTQSIKGTYRVGGVFGAHSCSIKEEANCGHLLALALAESVHELLQLGRPLDLEEHLIVVIGDLDVQVLRGGGRSVLLGHFEWSLVWDLSSD